MWFKREYFVEFICSIGLSRKSSNQKEEEKEKTKKRERRNEEGRGKRKTNEIGEKRIEERQTGGEKKKNRRG